MRLKELTKCCATPTLLWMRDQQCFMCPCGKTKADDRGNLLGTNTFNPWHKTKRARPKDGEERLPRQAFEDVYEDL